MNVTPTAKVSAVAAAGGVVTLALQLLQQYVHGFHAPTAATVSAIITVLVTVAGWVTRDLSSPNPPKSPSVPPQPTAVTAAVLNAVPDGWPRTGYGSPDSPLPGGLADGGGEGGTGAAPGIALPFPGGPSS